MTDRPIIMSAPDVRALLAGRKTQHRVVLKPQPYRVEGSHVAHLSSPWNASGCVGGRIVVSDRALLDLHRQPAVGDRFWVKESWRPISDELADDDLPRAALIRYRAGGEEAWMRVRSDRPKAMAFLSPRVDGGSDAWCSPASMFRWASRMTIVVTEVRVERLQDITEADAIAEGIGEISNPDKDGYRHFGLPGEPISLARHGLDQPTAARAYAVLWESLHGAGSWASNPWVALYVWEAVEHRNIDEEAA